MVKCGSAAMRACSLGFRVRDKVRVSVRDRVGVTLAARKIPHPRMPTFYT